MSTLLGRLKNRGCIHDASDFYQIDKLLDQERIAFYCGFDPTADSLHVGSMLPLLLMRRLQETGHKPIVVLGTATGMIGDPSGKSEERNLLTEDIIQENVRGIEKQIALFLSSEMENGVSIVRNDEWLKDLSCIDFLRDVGKHFSVNSMMIKDSVKSRLENREQGISYTEFSYMLFQAYDFFWLNHNMDCRMQVGGSDQWGNITAGLELVRRKSPENHPPAYGLTFPLLTTSSGEKFGKTAKGAVWLSAEKTSAYEFYQFWLNTADADVMNYLRLFSEFDDKELSALEAEFEEDPGKRSSQHALAFALTELVHGDAEAKRARDAGKVLFSQDTSSLDSKTLLEINRDVPSCSLGKAKLSQGLSIQELLVQTPLAKSKGEARRLIEGGGIYINDQRVRAYTDSVTQSHFVDDKVLVLRSGKKKKHLVILEG